MTDKPQYLTHATGTPVTDNLNIQTAGRRGPAPLQDIWLIEALHQVTIVMSERGIPRTFRHMHGFGSHTYSFINAANERIWVKFHFRTRQGIENLTDAEAEALVGKDRETYQRDLFESIENGDFPRWHVSGPHFRDYHLLLDEQSTQILAMTDPVAERVRKIGGTTLRSIGHIARLQRAPENDNDTVAAQYMLAELLEDNRSLLTNLRGAHSICDEHGDVATASLIENWIDETEQRAWFLAETGK
jgi:DNA-binding ferritin-like protein